MPLATPSMNASPTLTRRSARPIWPAMKSVFMTLAATKRRRRRIRDTARARFGA
jgi:hypothetical protein